MIAAGADMDLNRGGEMWRRLGRTELLRTPIFTATERDNEGPGGRRGRFVVLEASDWATVVPVLEREGEACFLMVRQYRHGSDEISIEFPGGCVDAGEDPAAAAARELEEETGYIAASIRSAGAIRPNPAFMNNRFHVFLAEDLERSGRINQDEHEVVDSVIVPVSEVQRLMGTGPYSHALMVAALYLAERLMRGPASGGAG
jgi:8-oxo-dGTP pyrophosphatase MutT (NUDIX family)